MHHARCLGGPVAGVKGMDGSHFDAGCRGVEVDPVTAEELVPVFKTER